MVWCGFFTDYKTTLEKLFCFVLGCGNITIFVQLYIKLIINALLILMGKREREHKNMSIKVQLPVLRLLMERNRIMKYIK